MKKKEAAATINDADVFHFGTCPVCWEESKTYHTNGHINVGSVHFYHCIRHKVAWCVGSNLFSAWRYENEKKWAENLAMLRREYRPVEAHHPPEWLMEQLSRAGEQN